MIQGLVSVLDPQHVTIIENLWAEMWQRFGVGNPDVKAIPHISYHVAEAYDQDKLSVILKEVAKEKRPFTITASGIGIFPAPNPIVYVPVVRTPELTRLHSQLYTRLEPIAHESNAYYAPNAWIPHITLGHYDVTREQLGPLSQWLHQQAINWSITIDNFYILTDNTRNHVEKFRVSLRKD